MPPTGVEANGATVLVVDDEPRLRELIAHVVARTGSRPLVASSVPEALELLDAEAVDLVLTDLTMPVLGGLDLLAELSARGSRIPVVVITGSDDAATLRACRLLGAEIVAKPFEFEELGALVAARASRRRLAA